MLQSRLNWTIFTIKWGQIEDFDLTATTVVGASVSHKPPPLSVVIRVRANGSHILAKLVSSYFHLPILPQLKHGIFHLYAKDFGPIVFMNIPLSSIHFLMIQTMINHLNILTVIQIVMHNTIADCYSGCVIQATIAGCISYFMQDTYIGYHAYYYGCNYYKLLCRVLMQIVLQTVNASCNAKYYVGCHAKYYCRMWCKILE